MPGKTFTLDCPPDQASLLAEVLGVYAQAAYPTGGSECAQVARETLLESARTIAAAVAGGRPAELRRRQRSHFKAAVSWYFSEEGPGDATRRQSMLALLP